MKADWQNDPQLTTYILEINRWKAHLERQQREKMESALFLSLMQLETAARKAQDRLNEMRYGKDFVFVEQMGT